MSPQARARKPRVDHNAAAVAQTRLYLDEVHRSQQLAATVSPEYADLRREILGLVADGATPSQIAGLLEQCSRRFTEIDWMEISDLRGRCDECWRRLEDCPGHETRATRRAPPPLESAANTGGSP